MAALADPPAAPQELSLADLRNISAASLAPLLSEQVKAWKTELDWDSTPSAELVRRFVQMQALSGYALVSKSNRNPEAAGYCYYVCEEGKGLIGDLFVSSAHRTVKNENALLEAALSAMWRTPGIRRIEAQLMMIHNPLDRTVPYSKWFYAYPRFFLEAPAAANLPAREIASAAIIPWDDSFHDAAAKLIADAYEGHIDSQINDQYRTIYGARRFLANIVQYPGCGAFFAPASFAAMDRSTHALCGASLASLVAHDIGHITQVCVAPSHRSIGLGYELMRRSIFALAARGCRAVSLTVTQSNEAAVRLYHNMGFVNRCSFAAYVWEPR